jgi:large subunit ribosomal protein L31
MDIFMQSCQTNNQKRYFIVKKGIHPASYQQVLVNCISCQNTFYIGTTKATLTSVEICSACHPAYRLEGGNRLIDTEGRVEKFNRRFGLTSTATVAN